MIGNTILPPVQVIIRVSKLKDVLFERVFASNLCLENIPYTSIIEAMYALFGDTITVEFIVSSLDDTPNLNELAR